MMLKCFHFIKEIWTASSEQTVDPLPKEQFDYGLLCVQLGQ